MTRASLTVAVALALLAPANAAASVRLVHISSPVRRSAYAGLTVSVSPARTCSVKVYDSHGRLEAPALPRKRPSNGRVSWSWRVGLQTTPGRHRILVSCGAAGSLRASFVTR